MKINLREFDFSKFEIGTYLIASVVIPVVFLVAGCGRDKIIANLGSEKITLSEFEKRLASVPPSYARYLDSTHGRRQFLDLMVREKLVVAEARKSGITKTKEYRETLERYESDSRRRLEELKDSLLMEAFLGKLHGEILNPTPEEIKKYYADNKADFANPFEMGVSHIVLLDDNTAADTLARLRRGESFEKLAAKISVDPTSAVRGGFLGNVKKGELAPELESVARKMNVGAVSGIVKTEYGYHIIKKMSAKFLEPVKFEAAQESIRRFMIKTRLDEWVKKTMEKKKVKINYELAEKASKISGGPGNGATEDDR
ncbi:MAG: peptidylprolyl isomerase [Endomicrobiia bacterium]|nr:peptidylprolyl isomerase [Endomicrobiia bacterium]